MKIFKGFVLAIRLVGLLIAIIIIIIGSYLLYLLFSQNKNKVEFCHNYQQQEIDQQVKSLGIEFTASNLECNTYYLYINDLEVQQLQVLETVFNQDLQLQAFIESKSHLILATFDLNMQITYITTSK